MIMLSAEVAKLTPTSMYWPVVLLVMRGLLIGPNTWNVGYEGVSPALVTEPFELYVVRPIARGKVNDRLLLPLVVAVELPSVAVTGV